MKREYYYGIYHETLSFLTHIFSDEEKNTIKRRFYAILWRNARTSSEHL